MNKPDENTLNRWLKGELEGEELCKVEAWAEDHAGELDAEFKCDIGWEALGANFMETVAASEEPPYAEFFNHKLMQAIESEESDEQVLESESIESSVSVWQKLRWMILPTAAAAAIAFYAGSQMNQAAAPLDGQPEIASYHLIYVPDSHVEAAFSETERATEIVLEGLRPISDELDIVQGETSVGDSPWMMVVQPSDENSVSENQITFF